MSGKCLLSYLNVQHHSEISGEYLFIISVCVYVYIMCLQTSNIIIA